MLDSSVNPVFSSPARPVWPPELPLISDEEWQALLCPADAMPLACAVHAGEKPDSASEEGSLS
jgi:hypothetical protein